MKIAREKSVFRGSDAVLNYLNPDENPYVPLVEIPESCNPFMGKQVRIFAKLMSALPLGNVKSLPALNMLLRAKEEGRLEEVHSLIENSSGNTVFSLAVLARRFGLNETMAIVSNEVTRGKLNLLRLFGTKISVNNEPICPDPNDTESGIYKSAKKGEEAGWFNPGQYHNIANPEAHKRWTGPQIWDQLDGDVSVFCCGLGTTGTMTGVGTFLKERSPTVQNVGVVRQPNNPTPGVRTRNLLAEIAFDWQKVVDAVEEVGTRDAYLHSLRLCREGIMAGPSAGFALSGLLSYLERQVQNATLDSLRNNKGEVHAVFIVPDSPLPYLDEYFEYLGEEHFSPIENAELLSKENGQPPVPFPSDPNPTTFDFELDVHQACESIYGASPSFAWEKLNEGAELSPIPNTVILDVRPRKEFDECHLPSAAPIDSDTLFAVLNQSQANLRDKRIVLICAVGLRTKAMAVALRERGIEAFSLAGGFHLWSEHDLPRWKNSNCRRAA